MTGERNNDADAAGAKVSAVWRDLTAAGGPLGDAEKMREFFAGVDSDTRERLFKTACLLGLTARMKDIYPYVAADLNRQDVLEESIRGGRLPVLETLAAFGWNFGFNKNVLLREAVFFCDGDVVAWLIDQGLDPQVRGAELLHLAVEACTLQGKGDVLRILLEKAAYTPAQRESGIVAAVQSNCASAVEVFLEQGYDVTRDDNRLIRRLAGLSAAMQKTLPLVIAAGADVHVQNEKPLAAAVETMCAPNIKELIDAGADPLFLPAAVWELAALRSRPVMDLLIAGAQARQAESQKIYMDMRLPDDLTVAVTQDGLTGWGVAARAGCLAHAIKQVSALPPAVRQDYIAPECFLAQNGRGLSVLGIALASGQGALLFDADLWGQRNEKVDTLYAAIRDIYKDVSAIPAPIRGAYGLLVQAALTSERQKRLRGDASSHKPRLR